MANVESAKDILAEYISQADHDDKYVDCVRVDDLKFVMAAINSQQAEIERLKQEENPCENCQEFVCDGCEYANS